MIDVYLPIAHISASLPFLVVLGLSSGFLSGLYGIGGGTIGVPLMIFFGIPIDIAVATSLLQMVGTSFVNVLRNIPSGNINYKIGAKIVLFSSVGSLVGVKIANILHSTKYFTAVISIMYIILLASMAAIMLSDAIISYFIGGKVIKRFHYNANYKVTKKEAPEIAYIDNVWKDKMNSFELFLLERGITSKDVVQSKQRKCINVTKVLWIRAGLVGTFIGVISGIMGIAGGFISVPAMVYIFHQPIIVASMTSSFIGLLTTIPACLMQMSNTSLVEPFIAIIASVFAAFGIRIGNTVGRMLPQRTLKLIFAFILIIICARFALKVFSPSFAIYDVSIV